MPEGASPMPAGPAGRVQRLRERLQELDCPAALVLEAQNIGYLTGFTGTTAAVLISRDEAVFVTDSRYAVQARAECPGFRLVVIRTSGEYDEAIAAEVQRLELPAVAFESDYAT